MSTSQWKLRFLLDENVHRALSIFLNKNGIDFILSPKGIKNGNLAVLSKTENRVLVTNDSDFDDPFLYPKEKIFSVVLLKIHQHLPDVLVNRFSSLLKEKNKTRRF